MDLQPWRYSSRVRSRVPPPQDSQASTDSELVPIEAGREIVITHLQETMISVASVRSIQTPKKFRA